MTTPMAVGETSGSGVKVGLPGSGVAVGGRGVAVGGTRVAVGVKVRGAKTCTCAETGGTVLMAVVSAVTKIYRPNMSAAAIAMANGKKRRRRRC